MKVYIIGISGMLGNCLFFNFNNNKKFITRGSIRSKSHRYLDKFKEKIDFNVDVKNFNYLKKKKNKRIPNIYIPVNLIKFLIIFINFLKISKLNFQMIDNLTSQKIEFDKTNEITKFLKIKILI